MKTFPTSLHARRNNSCRRPGCEKTVHKKAGWPSRASRNPARIARRTATAGCMISRKVIGPSERPMRFSHPRLSASSTIHLPGRAPWIWDYGSVSGASLDGASPPARRRSWRGPAEAGGLPPALVRTWFSPRMIRGLAILPGRLRLHQDRGPREAPGLVGAGRHRSSIERGAPSKIAATRPQQRRSARHPPAS